MQNILKYLFYISGQDQRMHDSSSDSDSENEIGGLFRIAKHEKEKKSFESDNGLDCSKFVIAIPRDWSDEKVEYFFHQLCAWRNKVK